MAHFRRRSQQVAWHSVASANGKKDSLSNNVPALLQLSLLTKKPKEQPHAHMQIPHTWLTFLSLNTVETCDASSSPAVPSLAYTSAGTCTVGTGGTTWNAGGGTWKVKSGATRVGTDGAGRNWWWRRQDGRWRRWKGWWSWWRRRFRRRRESPRRGLALTILFLEGKPSMRNVATCHHGSPNMC